MTDSQRKRMEALNKHILFDGGISSESFLAGYDCRDTEVKELRELCDKMSLNSLKIEIERDEFREQLRMAVEAIKSALIRQCFCDGDPNDSCALCDDLRGALQKIESMKGGQS